MVRDLIDEKHYYYIDFLNEQLEYFNELKKEYERETMTIHDERREVLYDEYLKICNNLSVIDTLYGCALDVDEYDNQLLFTYFRALLDVLSLSNFTPIEKLLVISKYVMANLETDLNPEYSIDIAHLDEFDFYYFSPREIRALIKSGQLIARLELPADAKTYRDKLLLLDIERYIKAYPINIEALMAINATFKEHFIDVYPHHTLEDIDFVIAFLRFFKVRDKDISAIERTLKEEYFHRFKARKGASSPKKKSNIIDFKRVRELYFQKRDAISSYYRDGEFIRPASYKQLLELIADMIDISMPFDAIAEMIAAWYHFSHQNNPLANYAEELKRYEYYAQVLPITKDLEFLRELFGMLFISNDEDYVMIKKYFEEECHRLDQVIREKYGYAYEFKAARLILEARDHR